jgi:predicted transcriptional regulator
MTQQTLSQEKPTEQFMRFLIKNGNWLNTTQISKKANMSWNTAFKYLERMYNRGWLSKKGNYWKART